MASRSAVPPLDLAPPKSWRRFVPPWLRSLIWVDSAPKYDAFLSYSWKSDSKVAPVIQSLIQQFLCPSYKLRAKTVFRDLSCLPAGSSLENELRDRLDCSTHLIVLASPEAATSDGMEMEARHWFSRKRDGEVVVIISSGDVATWEEIRDRLLPPSVRDNLKSAPVWASLRQRRDRILANPKDHQLHEELIEDLKQVLLRFYPTRDWGELRGEERSRRRRAIGLLSGLAFLFLVLALIAAGFAWAAASRQLAAEAIVDVFLNPASSAKKAISSWDKWHTTEAANAIEEAFEQSNVEAILPDPQNAPVSGVAFSPDGKWILTTNSWGKAWLWEVSNVRQRKIGPFQNYPLLHVSLDSFRRDNPQIILSEYDVLAAKAEAVFWDLQGHPHDSLLASTIGPLTAASFSKKGKYIVTAGEDDCAYVWETDYPYKKALVPFNTLGKLHTDIINSARFSSDERLVVTASQDGRAKVCNISDRQCVLLRKKTTALFSAEFSPVDNNVVVTGGQDRTATLWDIRDPKQPKADFGQHVADVRQAAFDHEGKRVITASVDGTAEIWDVQPKEPKLMLILRGHRGALNGAAFSPTDDNVVATASVDGTARVWRAKPLPNVTQTQDKVDYLRRVTKR
jgi:WD40 repeat protein